AHEHMASAVMRRVLGVVAEAAEPETGAPEVVVATPARQAHELGALLAAATAASCGWEVTFLGADLPAEEIAAAVRKRGASAVALSIVYPGHETELADELHRLRRDLPAWVTMVVGGAGARRLADRLEGDGITFLPALSDFRRHLARLHAGGGSPPNRARGNGSGW
ncbi:MAG TPA: cobalamin-dependent protein, partial [Longimicrobium sp.]|nr:cobalamin-dependent protein [Longimicrobium sp.]